MNQRPRVQLIYPKSKQDYLQRNGKRNVLFGTTLLGSDDEQRLLGHFAPRLQDDEGEPNDIWLLPNSNDATMTATLILYTRSQSVSTTHRSPFEPSLVLSYILPTIIRLSVLGTLKACSSIPSQKALALLLNLTPMLAQHPLEAPLENLADSYSETRQLNNTQTSTPADLIVTSSSPNCANSFRTLIPLCSLPTNTLLLPSCGIEDNRQCFWLTRCIGTGSTGNSGNVISQIPIVYIWLKLLNICIALMPGADNDLRLNFMCI
ncbi:hypothetical protein CPB83DRAFT_580012 [Crepidotus variabilis]|uniref:Uncharacterized protein n=1 Tax=Crepidotus variabilis TaxID=179855 RepID=A0A9P6EPG2_9AGAR|nr:hypothetical protein CPB83DRAFT_580012 [Crepidotus variabilis]